MDSQWGPVYNAFHRILSCGNKPIFGQYSKRDLYEGNMRPALGHGCGKQTPSASILFSHTNLLHVLKVGLGISRTNADSQWNPVYNAFHRFLVVETKRFVGSFVNVILTRQTCGKPAANLQPALEQGCGKQTQSAKKLFFTCYIFLMSKCKGD